ncbi:MAG: glucosidase [Actinomycetota bacterium]|nr:glucosidase [Actinomycetota bacterium]MDQ6947830.1 glucosidase [Actinomycetota bacterium]
MTDSMDRAERRRLDEDRQGTARWKWWGPYVSSRQWGTVREDYSAAGEPWLSFPFDHARSRAYRWGEDGLAAICDRWQHVCFGLALWNERDPFLKERLFGLTNGEGNHGEDVKEYWWALDSTPTHSFMRWLYKYPQAEFPYRWLLDESQRRGRDQPEFELVETGVFEAGRYLDVEVTYAKASPDDMCIRIDCTNRGPDRAPLHLVPTLWFRNTWSWGRDDRHPQMWAIDDTTVVADHGTLGRLWLSAEVADGGVVPELLFCENETNSQRLWGTPNQTSFPKDGINDHVVHGAPTVNPERTGTKGAVWYRLDVAPGATATLRLRLAKSARTADAFGPGFDDVVRQRRIEADEFFAEMASPTISTEAREVQRQAIAGLLWAKKYYRYEMREWLEGDPVGPPTPDQRRTGRNHDWAHVYNADIISMPDEWEYPWYAAWDLAFHMIPMAFVDPDFAKDQLILFCREWFMHPNGQLPAYEWSFSDVNPPVHAWAAWRVYKIDARNSGTNDYAFLKRIFHKLLINFSWWVNRKDADGSNVFEGGFLGLDNIGVFDRSAPLPNGARLEQSDATSWMAMFCLNMLAIALELAHHDRSYEDVATKFFEHFLAIANAMNNVGRHNISLWDPQDGFFYDVLSMNGHQTPMRIRSIVGLIPLFAVETIEPSLLDELPDFAARMRWFMKNRPDLCGNIFELGQLGQGRRQMLSILNPTRLRQVLRRMLDEDEFLSPHGIRSLSRWHSRHPVRIEVAGQTHEIEYQPAESTTGLFGGNSNWRGPVWFPINYLLVESLQKFHHYLGDDFTVEFPTGSGQPHSLDQVATELSRRLISLFLPDNQGQRPVNGGHELFDRDPLWRDYVTFAEYFHGDTGSGLGASHQTGWTALVAKLIRQSGPEPE